MQFSVSCLAQAHQRKLRDSFSANCIPITTNPPDTPQMNHTTLRKPSYNTAQTHSQNTVYIYILIVRDMDPTANLPNDALGLVFYQIIHGSVRSLKEWKEMLPLLHVCRRWRKIALPFVYGILCIALVPPPNQGQKSQPGDDSKAMDPTPDSGKYAVKENARLIDSLGFGMLPRKLNFSSTGAASLNHGLDSLSKLLLSCSSAPWPNISSLSIRFSWWISMDDIGQSGNPDAAKMDAIATIYAQQLSAAVPNVTKLVCFDDSLLPLPKAVDSKIADAFASKLQLFTSLSPLQMSAREFPTELTWLRFCLDERNTSLNAFPRAFSRSLRYLCIYYMSDEVAWQLFFDDKDAMMGDGNGQTNDITFGRLKQLELHYFFANDGIVGGASPSDVDATSTPRYRLRFPQLERLHINGCPSDCVFFTNSVLPSKLLVLNIEGMLDAIEAMSKLDLPAVELLRFQQSPGVPLGWWQNNTEALNGFLEKHCGSKCTGLILQQDTDYKLAPHVLEKAKIIHLSIGKVIGIVDLLEVIATLPDLVKLVVHNLAFRGMPAYVTNFDFSTQDSNSPQQPNTRIREIVLWDNFQKPLPQEAKRTLTKYLLKWVPTLIRVRHT